MCIAHYYVTSLKKEKKGKATHPTIAQTNKHIIARDTWMPSLENWDGGLKIFCGIRPPVCTDIYSTNSECR